MKAEYRYANKGDEDQIFDLLVTVFQETEESLANFKKDITDPNYVPAHRRIVAVDGRIVSHVHFIPRIMRVGMAEIPIGGIRFVATHPDYRGHRYAYQLMLDFLDYMKENGQVAEILTTPIPNYYRNMGWEAYIDRVATKIGVLNIPQEDNKIEIRDYQSSDLGEVMKLSNDFFSGITGSIVRSEASWKWVTEAYDFVRDNFLVVKDEGEIIAYLIFQKESDNLTVVEATNKLGRAEVYLSLLGYLAKRAIELKLPEIRSVLAIDHPLNDILRDFGARTELYVGWQSWRRMIKIGELSSYLRAISPELEKRLKASPYRDWRGSLIISREEGEKDTLVLDKGKIHSEDRVKADLGITVSGGGLEQLLIGYRGLVDLYNLGGVELVCGYGGGDPLSLEKALDLATYLFPRCYPWQSMIDASSI